LPDPQGIVKAISPDSGVAFRGRDGDAGSFARLVAYADPAGGATLSRGVQSRTERQLTHPEQLQLDERARE
jgi:hypothetical protein